MPWKETCKMNQREAFAISAMQEGANISALCRQYGISRKTGYKWMERFKELGCSGLKDLSRKRRTRHARELPEAVICDIIKLKQAHLKWGPKKIRELYRRQNPGSQQPSLSSFKRVLERCGLTKPRKRKRPASTQGRLNSGHVAAAPNEVWTVDFKGWWKSREGLRVEPLTIRDEFSKLIIDIRLLESSKTRNVREVFEQAFRTHGLPGAIRSDNGSPFASSRALFGLSRLSAWWLKLGIELERGRPGCPQDNGGHERMHLDIFRELQKQGVGCEQEAFDIWREEYNQLRPHEALDMQTPAEVYQSSSRHYSCKQEAPLCYPGMHERKVHNTRGIICFERDTYMLSSALGGEMVGLREEEQNKLSVWFAAQQLGEIDRRTRIFIPLQLQGNQSRQTKKKGVTLEL